MSVEPPGTPALLLKLAARREAAIVIESWRQHYNAVRPHSSLNYLTDTSSSSNIQPPKPEPLYRNEWLEKAEQVTRNEETQIKLEARCSPLPRASSQHQEIHFPPGADFSSENPICRGSLASLRCQIDFL